MLADFPTILALDFDGVLCDGLLGIFRLLGARTVKFGNPESQTPPDRLAPQFYRLRPVVETGWEMPILLRALILGISEEKILQDWLSVTRELIAREQLDAADMGKRLDAVRDEWIKTDLDSWLGLHQFYPGVIDRLHQMLSPAQTFPSETATQVFIVTTKEGRFVKQLLQQQGIQLPNDRIIGKESKRPKHQTLRQLIEAFAGDGVTLWFVEDRLLTLRSIEQQADLINVRLFLADWGYNTQAQRDSIQNDPKIRLLSLSEFSQDFSVWSD